MQTGKLPVEALNRMLARARQHDGVLIGAAYGEDAASPDTGAIVDRLTSAGVPAAVIGRVVDEDEGIRFTDGEDLPVFARDEIARYFEGDR